MTTTEVTAICVTFNRRDMVRAMLDGFEQMTPEPCRLLVGDNGSTDGACEELAARSSLEWFAVPEAAGTGERRPPGASVVSHGAALDFLVQKVTTPYVVTIDSDVSFLAPGWLSALLEPMRRFGYQAVGEYEMCIDGYQPRLAVHLLALRTDWLQATARSFRGAITFTDDDEAQRWQARVPRLRVTEDELSGYRTGAFFATGALLFRQLLLEDEPWATTPTGVRAMYRHDCHGSWPR